jgi:toxin ParE1/3/4
LSPRLFGNRSHLKIASGLALDNPQAALDLDLLFEQKADQIIAYWKFYKPGRMKGKRDALYTRIT